MKQFIVYFENGSYCTIYANKIMEHDTIITFRDNSNDIIATFFKSKIAAYGVADFVKKGE